MIRSIRLRFLARRKKKSLPGPAFNRIRFPVRACIVLQLGLLEGLNGFVFIYQRVAALIVPDLVGRCFFFFF